MHRGPNDAAEARAINPTSSPADMIAWSLERFRNQNMVMTSSFGMEGCALIDMVGRHGHPLTVVYLDTMFFFQETYDLVDRLRQRYPHLEFVNRGTTLTPEEQQARYGPELWKSDPNLCCRIRKVEPMRTALAGVDVWMAALRRTQSATRARLKMLDWDWQYHVLKFCPLANWERKEVWEYIQQNDVPYNALHERGYPTVGCTHCTAPVEGVKIGEYSRAGRWTGQNKTECGLHGDGI